MDVVSVWAEISAPLLGPPAGVVTRTLETGAFATSLRVTVVGFGAEGFGVFGDVDTSADDDAAEDAGAAEDVLEGVEDDVREAVGVVLESRDDCGVAAPCVDVDDVGGVEGRPPAFESADWLPHADSAATDVRRARAERVMVRMEPHRDGAVNCRRAYVPLLPSG